jgi:hypothetical protein
MMINMAEKACSIEEERCGVAFGARSRCDGALNTAWDF